MRPASSRLALALAALLAIQSAACTHTADGHIDDPRNALVARRGIVQLVDSDGSAMPVAPETQLSFIAKDGSQTDMVEAGLLCRTDWGLTIRQERSALCSSAAPLIAWDDIDGVHTDTFDGAATTAIAAGAVIILVAVVFALSAGAGKGSKSGSSSSSSSSSSPPRPTHTPSGGDTAPPAIAHGPFGGGGTTVVVVPRFGIGYGSYGYSSSYSRPADDDGTLFPRADARRATVRGVIGLDGGACVFSPGSCFTAGFRGGVRLFNLVELTLGLRAIEGWGVHDYPRATPVLGVAMHGELANWRRFALSLAGQFSRTSVMDFYANVLLGFRIAPVTHWWIGIFPIHPTYLSWSDGRGDLWTLQSTLDLSVDF